MSLVIINPSLYGGVPPLFTFGSVNKLVSNNLQASLGCGKSIVRTKGAGNDSYLSIDSVIDVDGQNLKGARVMVRASNGVLYSAYQDTGNNAIMKKYIDSPPWSASLGDISKPTDADTAAIAIAIDSNDLIHVVYWNNGVGLRYVTFDITTELWGIVVTAHSDTNTNGDPYVGISIDSANIPHVVFTIDGGDGFEGWRYRNRIGGSWNSAVTISGGTMHRRFDFLILQDDRPFIVCNLQGNNFAQITMTYGNVNNATSFSGIASPATLVDDFVPSCVQDARGDLFVSIVHNGDLKIRKNLLNDTDLVFSTVTVASSTGDNTSMTIDQANDLYIFTDNGAGVTQYYKSTNGGRSWGSAQTHNTGTVIDENIRTRWSNLNYHFPNKLDYTLNDESANDIYFNIVLSDTYETWRNNTSFTGSNNRNELGARSLVRTSTGILYQIQRGVAADHLEMNRSINEGVNFPEQDQAGTPTGVDTNAIACAIDSADIIHCIFWNQGVGLRYVTFDTGTGLWGTAVTAISKTTTVDVPFLAITIDSNDILHVAFNDNPASADRIRYTNRVGGSWKADIDVQGTSADHKFDITIDDDDIPQICGTKIDGSPTVYAFLGNQNDVTSWTTEVIISTGVTDVAPTIVVDKKGDTYIGYSTNADVIVKKHPKGASWTTGWETTVVVASGTFEDMSMILDRYDNPIIFTNNSGNTVFAYKSEDGGVTWSALDTSHNTPTATDEHIRCRWSFLNYYFPDQFDYTLCDTGASDIYFNKIVQTGSDHLYVVGRNPSDDEVEAWFSPTEGQTWELVNKPDSPTGVDEDSVSCAIDGLDDIHIAFQDDSIGARWVKFDMGTQSYGSSETILGETFNVEYNTSICVDINDAPHTACSTYVGTESIIYRDRASGIWSNGFQFGGSGDSDTSGMDITMDNLDRPVFCANFAISGNDRCYIRYGNANEPTIMDQETADSNVGNKFTPAMAVNSIGDIIVCWVRTNGDIRRIKHDKDAGIGTWETTDVTVAVGDFENCSMMVDERDNFVVFAVDSSNVTQVWISEDAGATWESGGTHDMQGITDEYVRVRWSYIYNHNPSKVDYTVYDPVTNDVYYNSGIIT